MSIRPPDVVLFMTDQQRFDQVGFRSDGFFETPALDGLAARGVRFDNAYSAAPTCVPARTALMTGMQPHRLPTQGATRSLREGTWTLPRALRGVGFQTALVGKMHFSPLHADHGFDTMRLCEHLSASDIGRRPDGRPDFDDYHDWLTDQGLDEYRAMPDGHGDPADVRTTVFPYESSVHPTAWVEREAHAVLDRRDDRPLFLVVSFPHPHAPLNPPEPYASRFDPSDVALPTDGFEVNAGLPPVFREALELNYGPYRTRRTDRVGAEALRRLLTRARALVCQIDDAMGRLLERLPLDRTLVFFTADHGDYAGHRGLLQKVPWIPFEDLIRVPLVMAGPGVPEGRREQSLVQAYDFVPTACEVAGAPVDLDELDARSLRPLTGGDGADTGRAVVFATSAGWPGARLGRFKYVRHRRTRQGVLFDLEADPGETRNLIEDPHHRDRLFEVALGLKAALDRDVPQLAAPT
jgi:choline-sulfatase